MQTAITEQSINPTNIKEKDRQSVRHGLVSLKRLGYAEQGAHADEKRSDVAISMALLSHGNVNAMV